MKKTGLLMVFLVLITAGLVFAQAVCNLYESGTPKLSAQVNVSGKTATINVRSYVGGERIAIYQVVCGGVTFGEWDIGGNLILDPLGATTITVTNTSSFSSKSTVKVFAKTCP